MAAKKINFTQQRIENLPTPEKGRTDYHDTGCPKLTCRISNTGEPLAKLRNVNDILSQTR